MDSSDLIPIAFTSSSFAFLYPNIFCTSAFLSATSLLALSADYSQLHHVTLASRGLASRVIYRDARMLTRIVEVRPGIMAVAANDKNSQSALILLDVETG